MSFRIVTLGASEVDASTNLPAIQASDTTTSDEDTEAFGNVGVYSALGVTALNWPKTADGWCEGLVIEDVGGMDGVLVGARDQRTAPIYGNLAPGDTILHSTGPKLASMVLCKEERQQIVLRTKDSTDKDMVVVLDGTDDKITVSGFKCVLSMARDQINLGISSDSGTASSIQLKADGTMVLNAKMLFLGKYALAAQGCGYGLGAASLASTSVFVQAFSALTERVRQWWAGRQVRALVAV